MFCDNCGATLESGSKFCDSCGKALELSVTGGQLNTAFGPPELPGRRWGKPLLIIALAAVAGSAVILYVTQQPESSMARGFSHAVESVLRPSTLSRSDAQAILEAFPKPEPITVNIEIDKPYERDVYDSGLFSITMGQPDAVPLEALCVRAGLLIQERSEIPEHLEPEAGMGGPNPPMVTVPAVPTYINRLTPRGQTYMPSGRIVIPVTRTITVTGISMGESGKTADVTFTVTYGAATFAGNTDFTNALLKRANYSRTPQAGQKLMQKFDNGWRVVG